MPFWCETSPHGVVGRSRRGRTATGGRSTGVMRLPWSRRKSDHGAPREESPGGGPSPRTSIMSIQMVSSWHQAGRYAGCSSFLSVSPCLSTWHRSCNESLRARRRGPGGVMDIAFPQRECEREERARYQQSVCIIAFRRGDFDGLEPALFSIAGRFAIATLLWASLTVPAALTVTAQDSTPRAATPMTGVQRATPMADARGGARRAADRCVR